MALPLGSFCEANLGHFIEQPANAWSNLAYIFIGIYFIYKTKSTSSFLKFFGPIALIIGVSSFFYHASWTLLAEFFDLGSMLLLISFLLCWNIKRFKPKISFFLLFTIILIINLALLYFSGLMSGGYEWGKFIFGIEVVILFIFECLIYYKHNKSYKLNNFILAFAILLVAWFVWYLDRAKIWCSSTSFHIINGHVIWHILTAIALIFLYKFYKQFGFEKEIE